MHTQPREEHSGNGTSSEMPSFNTTNGAQKLQGLNGHSNGPSKSRRTYFDHDREEITRLILQALCDLGYDNAAQTLSRESGHELESPSVAAFRTAVLQGEWREAEDLLFGVGEENVDGGASLYLNGLQLAEDADREYMKFQLREQKFLELLEQQDTGRALHILRTELQPLHQDVGKVHFLSALVMCPTPEDLRNRARWDGAQGSSRQDLLSELSRCISPSIMIPEHRLAVLLQQVKKAQITSCMYHHTEASPSLYMDHRCDRETFPTRVVKELGVRPDDGPTEIWITQFSHSGRYLATGGSDGIATIYDTTSWHVTTCAIHDDAITYISWSPDDTMLATASHNCQARLWKFNGDLMATIADFETPVTCVRWSPVGKTIFTGSLSMSKSLCEWSLDGELVYDWGAAARVSGLAISPDMQWLVATDVSNLVHVYSYANHQLEYKIDLHSKASSVNINQDSTQMLLGLDTGECRLIDIETREVLKTFEGFKAGEFVIQSNFGGANESFVICGSEDGFIYIWHKETGALIEKLDAHTPSCCSAVAWNPTNPCMFASGGDDSKIRIWSNESSNAVVDTGSSLYGNGRANNGWSEGI